MTLAKANINGRNSITFKYILMQLSNNNESDKSPSDEIRIVIRSCPFADCIWPTSSTHASDLGFLYTIEGVLRKNIIYKMMIDFDKFDKPLDLLGFRSSLLV